MATTQAGSAASLVRESTRSNGTAPSAPTAQTRKPSFARSIAGSPTFVVVDAPSARFPSNHHGIRDAAGRGGIHRVSSIHSSSHLSMCLVRSSGNGPSGSVRSARNLQRRSNPMSETSSVPPRLAKAASISANSGDSGFSSCHPFAAQGTTSTNSGSALSSPGRKFGGASEPVRKAAETG